ncbi:C-type lectin BfL-2-like [Haliotis rubra]|uniref:C-type lectin BfL-2-like n=1 Tax=Haliotis rubra TaxID=36100 RepID=UPI001EE5DCDA|nr:C-type lectin BfL-2-like [Haliotis rubra]
MFPGLQIVLTLHGYFLSSEPHGLVVVSRCECISKCFFNMTCRSLFYRTSSKTCYLSDAVYTKDDLPVSSDMQYLVWKRDGCGNGYSWNPKLHLCYNVHTGSPKSWTDAENTCIQDGGHLLKVDNLETNLLMNHFAVKHGVSMWLGGTDIKEEGTWVWADNTSIKSVWWNTEGGQPQRRTDQNCLALVHSSDNAVNKWHDHNCTKGHRYVCQLPVEPTPC